MGFLAGAALLLLHIPRSEVSLPTPITPAKLRPRKNALKQP
jgi:hypothetical protein